MTGHYLKQLAVVAVGFVLGLGLGRLIAPERVAVWILAGLAVALYGRAMIFEWFGGDWFVPHSRLARRRRHRRTPHRVVLHH